VSHYVIPHDDYDGYDVSFHDDDRDDYDVSFHDEVDTMAHIEVGIEVGIEVDIGVNTEV